MCGRVKSSNLITSVETNMFGSTSAVPYIEIDHMDAYDPSSNVDTDGDTSNAVLSFVNEWLSAISDAVVGLLIVQIFQIPFLSLAGCTQLATDVEYLRYEFFITL